MPKRVKCCTKIFLVSFSFVLQAGGNVSLGWSPPRWCQGQPAGLAAFCGVLPDRPKRESSRKCQCSGCRGLFRGLPLPWGDSPLVPLSPHVGWCRSWSIPSSLLNSQSSATQFQKGFFLEAACLNPRKSRKCSVERVYKGNNAPQAAPVCWVALFLFGAVIHPLCQKPKLMMRSSGKRRWPRLCFSLCLC